MTQSTRKPSFIPSSDADQLCAGIDNGGAFALAVGQRDPTGAQSELLGEQDELFSVIARALVKRIVLLTDKGDVVADADEVSVMGQKALEGVRLLGDELDAHFCGGSIFLDGLLHREQNVLRNGSGEIGAHGMALFHRLADG